MDFSYDPSRPQGYVKAACICQGQTQDAKKDDDSLNRKTVVKPSYCGLA